MLKKNCQTNILQGKNHMHNKLKNYIQHKYVNNHSVRCENKQNLVKIVSIKDILNSFWK